MRLLIVGHSHINALSRAYEENGEQADGVRIDFLNFREEKYWKGNVPPRTPEMSKLDALLPDFSSLANAADIVVFCINGNEHNNVGMFEFPSRNFGDAQILVKRNAAENYKAWLKRLLPCFEKPAVFLPPPPPFETEEFMLGTGKIEKIGKGVLKVRRAQERLALWMLQCRVIEELGLEFGLEVIRLQRTGLGVDAFEIAVSDNGHGIPEDQLPGIFDESRQVRANSTSATGTGLGLAIVSRFSELQGGRVIAESTLGKGSTFRVWLPVDASHWDSEVGAQPRIPDCGSRIIDCDPGFRIGRCRRTVILRSEATKDLTPVVLPAEAPVSTIQREPSLL